MAKDTRWTPAIRSTAATAMSTPFNNGYLEIYTSPRPATPLTAISTQTKLAELRFAATAVASVTDGVATFNTMTPDASADATGTAVWARVLQSDGTTALCDVSVGTSDANIIVPTTSIVAAIEVAVTSASFTVAATSAQ